MKITLAVIATLALGALWTLESMDRAILQRQVGSLRQQKEDMDALQRERERLRAIKPGTEELSVLQRSAAEHAGIRRALSARAMDVLPGSPAQLAIGQWLSPTAWKNRGQDTPSATVETILWAAAGGDVASLKNLLLLDDAVRTKAGEVLAQLPEASRASYPGPDHLIAAFTTKAIPLGDAQLVWQHQSSPDDAVVCVFVRNTESATAEGPLERPPPSEKVPPMAPSSNKTKSAYLSLRRIGDSWQVVVPMSAVENIAKELHGRAPR
jgi:hypothetical protein